MRRYITRDLFFSHQKNNIGTFFKYRDWRNAFHKRILTENELYFSAPSQFNDPFDAQIPFLYKEEDLTLANIRKRLSYEVRKNNPDPRINDNVVSGIVTSIIEKGGYTPDEINNRVLEYMDEYKKHINRTWTICSFTIHPDNLLMWSHYADSHRSFCVGLDTNYVEKINDITIIPVEYSEGFPNLPILNDHDEYYKLITTKSTHWGYEDEYRVVRLTEFGNIVKLPNEAYTQLIFGLKIDPEIRKEVIELAKSKFPRIEIFDSKMKRTSFGIDLVPI